MKIYQQFLTRNSCFAMGQQMTPCGVMVHSTGANNPRLSRYVPGNDAIGRNTNGNHWDQSNAEWKKKFGDALNKCVHAFVGQTYNGEVAVVQTLPWEMRGWHAGMPAGNNRYIGFEICEDGLADPDYFRETYDTAVELVAHLCKTFGWDPMQDGVVICHAEGFQRGLASNHGDVLHWWKLFGYDMDKFRRDVEQKMLEENEEMNQEQFDKMMENWLARQADKPVSAWAKKLFDDAVDRGITDGQRPQALATRQEVALMIRAATL